MTVIPISGKAGHGKDTFAGFLKKHLEEQGNKVLIIHYGDLLKWICRQYFGWDGQKDEAGRTLLQHIGTEVVRKEKPNYWVGFVKSVLVLFHDYWDYVLIPDTRFPNEIEDLKKSAVITSGVVQLKVVPFRIVRPGFNMLTEEQQKHPSETALDDYPWTEKSTVMNDSSLELLDAWAKTVAVWLPMGLYD